MAGLGKGRRISGHERTQLVAHLRDRYIAGESIRSLSQSTGRSYGFIHRLLLESEVDLRGRGGNTRGAKKT
jgi:hypothetical protein